jgi:hypothetical protein
MRQRTALLTALLVVLVGAGPVRAQLYAPETIDQDFRVEWQVGQNRKGPTVEGYVYNKAMRGATTCDSRSTSSTAPAGSWVPRRR